MKPSTKIQLLVIIGLLVMWPGLLQKRLALPEWSAVAFPLAGLIFIGVGFWLMLRTKRRGEIPALTPSKEKRVTRVSILTAIVAAVLSPFVLRYIGMGVHLTLAEWMLVGVVTFVIGLGAVLIGTWLRRKDLTNR